MPQLVIDKQYEDGTILTEAHLDAAFDSLATLLNTTGLGADNIQDNSIGPNELQTSAVSNTKLATNSVSTVKIQDNAITLAKLAADLQAFLVPTATVAHYAGDTAPTGWLICDGGAISRTTYVDLFTKVGVRFGSGDGTTTFNLPDGRGRVIRMVDGSAGRDPDSAARTAMNSGGAVGNNIGSIQEDEFKSHTHTPPTGQGAFFTTAGVGSTIFGGGGAVGVPGATAASGGNETRMKNWNSNLIIKT